MNDEQKNQNDLNDNTIDEPLVFSASPAIILLLISAERDKGAPLTQTEVEQISGDAIGVAVPFSVKVDLALMRGYNDLDGPDFWEDWLDYCRDRDEDSDS